MMRGRLVVDRSKCVGSGNCAATAPALFDQDEADATVVLLQAEPSPEQAADALTAVELCPARAIRFLAEP